MVQPSVKNKENSVCHQRQVDKASHSTYHNPPPRYNNQRSSRVAYQVAPHPRLASIAMLCTGTPSVNNGSHRTEHAKSTTPDHAQPLYQNLVPGPRSNLGALFPKSKLQAETTLQAPRATQRWSLRLSTYNYEIHYLKGSQQYEADLLSRNLFVGFVSADIIKQHQPTASPFNIDTKGLHTITRKGVIKIIIPETLQHTLMNKVHQEYNHPDISQMTRIITTQYYWKGISKSIEKFVKSCRTCQIIKRPKDTIAGFSKYGHSKTYLHVIVDHLTRYAWTFPSKSTSTLTAPAFTSEKFRKFLITQVDRILQRLPDLTTFIADRMTKTKNDTTKKIQPPETFDFSTPNEWPKWRKRFDGYLVVSGMKKKEEADKIDLFMYLMGDRADDIFRTFKFEKEEEATKIDSVLKAFDRHFCVRKNIIYERAKINSRIQEDLEPVDEFITSLYKLADSCEFEGLHEQLIRVRIVVGVRDKALSERMQ
ncbi:hypothetical protein LAZ67_20001418 [Cordylochernes scorpioides]|uniref:RNA-directed DNA polymerase n=1 Tax=Cordylochernes scorpioides TaxID=51811 RepID=A0ABY6LK85_9ARAC|nr:hypothetical protein LAZ67_20001418 [Cordylochernes scorpioides]